MKRSLLLILLVVMMTTNTLIAQQNVYNRSDAGTGFWWHDSKPWYYQTWNNNQDRPDLTLQTRNNVFIGHNNNTAMTVNGAFFHLRTLTFEAGATTDRSMVSADGGGISISVGLYNNSTGAHSFNVPIGVDGSDVEFVANSGNLTFLTDFYLNANTATFKGDNVITVSGVLSGSGNLSKVGAGTLILNGENTYSGSSIISGGILQLNRTGGTTIPTTNNVTVNGGTFRVSSNQTLNNLTIEEGGILLVDGGVTLTINGNLTLNESVTISGNLVIGSNGTSEVALGKTLTNNGSLTIKSGPSGTGSLIVNGSIAGAGSFSLERYMPQAAQTWHYMSAPVNGSISANGFNPGGAEDFFTWSESSPGTWVNYKNTTESPTFAEANGSDFVKGRGYLVAYTGTDPIKTFNTGTLTTGNVDIQLKRSAAKSWTYEPGWNLLGNPYTSGIDWNLANRTRFEDNFAYVYDPNKNGGAGFVNINGGNPNAYIAANQGFYVRVADGYNNQNFTFTSGMQVANGAFMKQQTMEDQLVLKLSFGDYFDKTYIQINAESSAVRDKNDALKLFSYDANVPQLFSKSSNDVMLAVNSFPELNENTQIAIGLRTPAQGTYSIEVAESSNVFHANSLYLKDQKLNIMHNLSQNPIYFFTSAEGDDPNRFLLHFGLVSVGEQLPTETLQAYAYNDRLFVNSSLEMASLSVYDLQGRLLLQRQINESGLQSVEMEMPAGVYIVRLQNTQQSKSVKIVVQ
jgi:autotransporter-associated beta strand protein